MKTVSTVDNRPALSPNRKVQVGGMVSAVSTLVMFGITGYVFDGSLTSPEVAGAISTIVTGAVSTIFGFGAAYLTAPHPNEGVAKVPS